MHTGGRSKPCIKALKSGSRSRSAKVLDIDAVCRLEEEPEFVASKPAGFILTAIDLECGADLIERVSLKREHRCVMKHEDKACCGAEAVPCRLKMPGQMDGLQQLPQASERH
jgi:hypothetical protein